MRSQRGGGGSGRNAVTYSGPNSKVKGASGAGARGNDAGQKPSSSHGSVNPQRRRAPTRSDRIDLTTMKSSDFNNLLDDVDKDLVEDNAKIASDEKEAEASRKESLSLVHTEVTQTNNIFDDNDGKCWCQAFFLISLLLVNDCNLFVLIPADSTPVTQENPLHRG